MKKNSVKYLEGLIEGKIRKRISSLKMYRYKDKGIEHIVDEVIPTKPKDLMAIAEQSHWLITKAPEEYVYGEMIDIANAVASNLRGHLLRFAQSYVNNYRA
tara:strand:- start:432 stop:734 length:303 start_codon:yes stop_codon:yes gene_type:complete